jgi:hypothetical protein
VLRAPEQARAGVLRRQVYLAGFAASRSNALKPLYLALRAKGFASTQAFIILGRKLLRGIRYLERHPIVRSDALAAEK